MLRLPPCCFSRFANRLVTAILLPDILSTTQPQLPPRFVHDHLIVGDVYYIIGVCVSAHRYTGIRSYYLALHPRTGAVFPFHQTDVILVIGDDDYVLSLCHYAPSRWDAHGSASDQRFRTIVLCRPASRTAYGPSNCDVTLLTSATRCRRALTSLQLPTTTHHFTSSELIFTTHLLLFAFLHHP